MSSEKIKWMAAIPYLLVLTIIINGNILGNYDIYFFGAQLSLITLIPYLIYHFVNKNHENEFVAAHTKMAMRIFKQYFILTLLISIVMYTIGFSIMTANRDLLFASGSAWLMLILPFFFVVIYAIIKTTQGSIRAFKLTLPNKTTWDSSVTDYVEPGITQQISHTDANDAALR